jgi:curved DNA-binding protein CbpA
MPEDPFVDYYEFMQISSNAEVETIHRVYRMLAARYHPDNRQSGDLERFFRLGQAYGVLSDPERRRQYDLVYQTRRLEPIGVFNLKEFTLGIDGEVNRRLGILCLLYSHRRTDPEHPGTSVLELERMMSFAREHLLFTLWYLRDKEYVRQDESSDFELTAAGADYVETNLPKNNVLYMLLKAAESGRVRAASIRSDPEDRSCSGEPADSSASAPPNGPGAGHRIPGE